MADAWLLQAGDPLPTLPIRGGAWRIGDFAGQWGVVVVAPVAMALAALDDVVLLAIVSPAPQLGPSAPWRGDTTGEAALRLGARLADGRVAPVAVLVEPGGLVAGAVQGSSAAEAVARALAIYRELRRRPG